MIPQIPKETITRDFVFWLLSQAAMHGHLPVVQYLVEEVLPYLPIPDNAKQIILNSNLVRAGSYGQLPIIVYLISHGATDLNATLLQTINDQRLPIVHYLVEHGANNFNDALLEASKRGALQVAEYLVSHGANNLNEALEEAAKAGHLNVVQFLATHGATELRYPMRLLSAMFAKDEYQREQWNRISDYLETEIQRRRESRSSRRRQ